MTLRKSYRNFEVELFNDTLYDPNSTDNSRAHSNVYSDSQHDNYFYLTRHGINLIKDEELTSSALVSSSGGTTGIHETCALIDENRLLICCGHSVYCLSQPELTLVWRTQADSATCFEVFQVQQGYIVHGELEVSRLNKEGGIVWEFSGSDIFVTANRYGDFEIDGDKITAKNWEGLEYSLDVETGQVLNVTSSNA